MERDDPGSKPANYTGQLIDEIKRNLDGISILTEVLMLFERGGHQGFAPERVRGLVSLISEVQGQKAEHTKSLFEELLAEFEPAIHSQKAG